MKITDRDIRRHGDKIGWPLEKSEPMPDGELASHADKLLEVVSNMLIADAAYQHAVTVAHPQNIETGNDQLYSGKISYQKGDYHLEVAYGQDIESEYLVIDKHDMDGESRTQVRVSLWDVHGDFGTTQRGSVAYYEINDVVSSSAVNTTTAVEKVRLFAESI